MATPKRYFEFVDDSSSKFWEIWMEGNDVTTQWGRIGTTGQTKEARRSRTRPRRRRNTTSFSPRRLDKGYVEKPRS